MNRAMRLLLPLAALLILAGCDGISRPAATPPAPASETREPVKETPAAEAPAPQPPEPQRTPPVSEFHDFGDPNFRRFIGKMRALAQGGAPAGSVLRIVQFGDSHTASDTITSGLRLRWQRRYGDAGIGWVAPMKAPGQGHTLVGYRGSGWKLVTSRLANANDTRQKVFPLGGYIATPVKKPSHLIIQAREESDEEWNVRLSIRQWKAPLTLTDARGRRHVVEAVRPFGLWRDVAIRVPLRLPLTITAASPGDADLGGVWLEKRNASGVTVSPIGLNGAILKNWEFWSDPQWTRQLSASEADMVILAYGTNEANRPDLDLAETQGVLREALKTVRAALPESVIVVVGAPDALLTLPNGESCDARLLPRLREVKEIQQKAAEEARTLFWDWQAAMGGPCGMDAWIADGFAKDKVHLTLAGYQKIAEIFNDDLTALIERTMPGD